MIGTTMKLKDYLYFNELTLVDMAKDLMIAPNHLGGISRGERKPSIRLAKAIEVYTGGKVTVEEIMTQEPKKNKRKTKPASAALTSNRSRKVN